VAKKHGARVKSYVFEDLGMVVIFCPRISSCRRFCSTFRRYRKRGYNILCLNPEFYKPSDLDEIRREETERRKKLKNKLGY